MIKYKGTFNQKFDIREVMVSLTCGEDEIEIISEDLSKNVMRKLAAELVYDGYAENVEVEKGRILLIAPDAWMCSQYNLKEATSSKLEEMGFESHFL